MEIRPKVFGTRLASSVRSWPLRTAVLYLTLVILISFLSAPLPTAEGNEKQVQVSGDYEIAYFSSPVSLVADSPATLFVQARNVSSGEELRVVHFLVQMIPPSGPRIIQHPLSNSTVFRFNQAGHWVLLLEIGLKSLGIFDATATFGEDVSQQGGETLLSVFLNALIVGASSTLARWYILALLILMGVTLYVIKRYRSSPRSIEVTPETDAV